MRDFSNDLEFHQAMLSKHRDVVKLPSNQKPTSNDAGDHWGDHWGRYPWGPLGTLPLTGRKERAASPYMHYMHTQAPFANRLMASELVIG